MPLLATAEAALFGAVVPAGSYVAFTSLQETVASPLTFVLGWVGLIAIGTALLGTVRDHPTDSLLSGSLVGLVVGFAGFATLVGWSLASFSLPLLAMGAVVAGAWGSYEWCRRRGSVEEPSFGTWRILFTLFLIVPAAGLALLPLI